ncbi:MAG: OmpH family outer membrane protein [Pseudomonadota bacterium]|jgi:outer membrane protein|nr:OmpH family outer membrane protein [Rubrivivax sp.]MCA3259399.1 OmpH family outer membrane protein [Rubrivivax sp.]MCE2910761.1 OmpH family outer membrane protein [Rubrivivax sp.]MCZ8031006.1 OmpH family outer membrane protein [Rubrivivax sp.]
MKASLRALLLTGLLAAATLGAGPVMSQDLKIGYVNSERVLRDAAPAKAAQAKLEAEFGRRERDLVEQTNRLKAAADKLEKDGPTLSETERNRRQRELVDQDRDLQRKRREFQEDLNQRRNEELASVVERANRVIKSIFETEKYDLILQEVVFAGPRVDITDKVIRALNGPAAPAPAAPTAPR